MPRILLSITSNFGCSSYAKYRLSRDLTEFKTVTIYFQHRFKMPRELWGGEGEVLSEKSWKIMKNVLDLDLLAPPLAEPRVTPVS
jgi:hypothetical protein